jgi:hypothetical protein
MPEYPFIPTRANELTPGDWWEIVQGRTFGFGVCVAPWNNRGVLAAILAVVKQEPVLNPEDSLEIFEMGHLDLRGIGYCGGQVRGNVPLDIGDLHATHRTTDYR